MSPRKFNLGVVGCGVMGTAIVAGILNDAPQAQSERSSRWVVDQIFISVQSAASVVRLEDTLSQNLHRVTIYQSDNLAVVKNSDIIILGCKPHLMKHVLGTDSLGQALHGKTLVSVLPGTSTQATQNAIHASIDLSQRPESECDVKVVRTMPNLAAKVGASMTVVASSPAESESEAVDVTKWLFNHVGSTQEIPEELFDLIGSLVGCSAAMFTVAIDGLLDQCVSGGLRRVEALRMVTQSVLGLAKLLEAGAHPSVLREEIASPGGTTIRSLQELERRGVRSAFDSALGAAGARARELCLK